MEAKRFLLILGQTLRSKDKFFWDFPVLSFIAYACQDLVK
jgi:hypothetical protein